MTDLESQLKKIEERLEAATPGPWSTFFDDLRHCANDIQAKDYGGRSYVLAGMNRHFSNWKNDAEFIAHSPSDIRNLIDACRILKNAVSNGNYHTQVSKESHCFYCNSLMEASKCLERK